MAGEPAADDVDLVHLLGGEEEFLATRAGKENVNGGVNALVADLAVEDELHVAGALELLENEVVHAAVGLDEGGRHDGERSGLLGVARGGEELAGDLHGAGVHAAAHGAAATALRVVERAADAGERVHEDEDILPLLDEALGAVDGDLGDAGVTAEIAVVRAGVKLGLRDGALDLGDLLGTLVDQKDNELHLGVVLHHGVGDVLEQGGLAGAGRGDDEAALPLSDRRHEIHDTGGEALGDSLELDPLVRADGGQFLEEGDVHELRGIGSLDLGGAEELDATGAAAGLTLDENAVAEVVLADDFRGDEDVVLGRGVGALGLAEESESLAGDLDNPLGVGRLGRRPILHGDVPGGRRGKLVRAGTMLALATLIVGTAVVPVVPIVPERPAAAGIATSTPAVAVKPASSPTLTALLLSSLGAAALVGGCLGGRGLCGGLIVGLMVVAHGMKRCLG